MQCLLFRWCWVKCDELRCSRIAIAQQIGAKSCLILPGKEINMQTINGAHPVAVVMHRDSDLSIHEHLVVTWSHIGDLWPAQSPLNLEPGLLCQKNPQRWPQKRSLNLITAVIAPVWCVSDVYTIELWYRGAAMAVKKLQKHTSNKWSTL